MFNKLFNLIEHGNEWHVMEDVIAGIEHILAQFEDESVKEGSYPAAIDAVCEIFQEYKERHLKQQGIIDA